MFIQKTFFIILSGVLLVGAMFAQQKSDIDLKKIEVPADVQQKAVALLRETIKELSVLRITQNRQVLSFEMAALLWKYDQKEARPVFEAAMNDVRRKLTELRPEALKLETKIEEAERSEANTMANAPARVYSGNANYAGNKPPAFYLETQEFLQKYLPIVGSRKILIEKLAEAEPQTAYSFLVETEKLMPESLKDSYSILYEDSKMKLRITQIMVQKDIDTAVNIARGMVDEPLKSEALTTMEIIYSANHERGSQLAEEILQRILTMKDFSAKLSRLGEFMTIAIRNNRETNKTPGTPLLSDKSIRVLANLLADTALAYKPENMYTPERYARLTEKYAPQKAARIRLKFKDKLKNSDYNYDYGYSDNTGYYPANAANVNTMMIRAVNASRANVNAQKMTKAQLEAWKTAELVREKAIMAEQEERRKKEEDEKLLLEKLQDGKFTAAERSRVIEQIKQRALGDMFTEDYERFGIFGGASGMRITKIKKLAFYAGLSGDREIAEKLMDEAASLAKPKPKSYLDYLSNLWLANGYSKYQPEKSFTVLENSIAPFNDLISAAVKVGGFIDDGNLFIDNDEVMITVIFTGPGAGFGPDFEDIFGRRTVLINLAKADFARTKGLTDRFERPEFRMVARFLLLEALLGEEKKSNRYSSGSYID